MACSDERDVLRRKCWLEGRRTRKGNKDNNSGVNTEPHVVSTRLS